MNNSLTFQNAYEGVSCVISAVACLKNDSVDFRLRPVDVAITATISSFIPSNFSTDISSKRIIETSISEKNLKLI
ncbi:MULTISPECIES: hypothetical protein [Mesonia]|uniref:Uncharacterized protein n=1 Tax=Mesonia oceanica TaxID=2687242 RepID=A0AC61Y7K4_9FLAO|nr:MULTISPECIES: hypothetical protein [Mesonia]VVV00479.1 hypothetical protein FVB9532_01750 [Mesonia oceanica]